MKLEEFAALLNGREYGEEISKDEEAIAKQFGCVICFGHSDDCIELRGAIRDEVGAYDGCEIRIIHGVVWSDDSIDEAKPILEKLRLELPPARIINTEWEPQGIEASWLITTDGGVPFDIMEDGDLYCRGCVFRLEETE